MRPAPKRKSNELRACAFRYSGRAPITSERSIAVAQFDLSEELRKRLALRERAS
jgi:hypothetical protein